MAPPNRIDPTLLALRDRLVSGATATSVLGRWLADHGIIAPTIVARRLAAGAASAAGDEDVRARLGAGPEEPVLHRHVALCWGDMVLAEADNFYLPGRLPAAMAELLLGSDLPFGAVVAPLGPVRETLATEIFPGDAAPLRLHALLRAGGRPLAEVRERFGERLLRLSPAAPGRPGPDVPEAR